MDYIASTATRTRLCGLTFDMSCMTRLAGACSSMEGLDLTALRRRLGQPEHFIEGPCESNGVNKEECK